jgi:hypothetical protein
MYPEATAAAVGAALPGLLAVLACLLFFIYIVMSHAYLLADAMTTGCDSSDWLLVGNIIDGIRWYHIVLLVIFISVAFYTVWSIQWLCAGGTIKGTESVSARI